MHLNSGSQSTLYGLPDGQAGTRATLRLMSRLIRSYKTNSIIREKAADLVGWLPGQEYRAEATELHRFVRDEIRYLQDVNGVETVQSPDVTLQLGQGDCDDKTTLLGALLESIGHPVRLIAVGYGAPGEFDHVYLETRIGGNWVAAETAVPGAEFGWSCVQDRHPSAYMRENV